MKMRKIKAIGAAIATVAMAAASVVAVSAPAQAAQYSGCSGTYRLCFFYSPSYAGASTNFSDGYMPDLISPTMYRWPNNGAGAGERVGNNAASAQNRWGAGVSAIIYYSANFGQPSVTIGPNGSVSNLGTLRNNNRSFRITE